MAKKIPTVSKWGQDTARERYQVGGMLPPQAMARPMTSGLPPQAMGRRPFKEGGPASKRPGTGMFPGESEQERQDEESSRQRRKTSQPMGTSATFGAQWSGGERERGIESGFKRGGRK